MKHWFGRFALGLLGLGAIETNGTADTLAQFRIFSSSTGEALLFGEVDVRLFLQDKPITVKNFIHYVERGDYQNLFFHRAIPGFVLQAGAYRALNVFDASVFGPPYSNIGVVQKQDPIANEYNGDPRFSNLFGTIAMAKLPGNPDSASSEWFFNLNNNAGNLDNQNGGFTVFGETVSGEDVLAIFNTISKGNNYVDLRDTYGTSDPVAGLFGELPTFAAGTAPPPYNELIFIQINLLTIRSISMSETGKPVIEWQGINGVENRVEASNNAGTDWEIVHRVDGHGGRMTFTDESAPNEGRLYRIRIDY